MSDNARMNRRDLLTTAGVAGLACLSAADAKAEALDGSGGDLAERRRAAERLRTDLAREYSHILYDITRPT